MTTQTRDLSNNERDRLGAFLQGSQPVKGMPLSALDGMFAAIAAGPGVILPSIWIPPIWDNEPPEFQSQAEAQEIMALLMRFYNAVVHHINEGTYTPLLDVLVLENGNEVMSPEDWGTGFMVGLKPRFELWEREIESDRGLGKMVEKIVKLAKPSDSAVKKLISPTQRERILQPIPDDVSGSMASIASRKHQSNHIIYPETSPATRRPTSPAPETTPQYAPSPGSHPRCTPGSA